MKYLFGILLFSILLIGFTHVYAEQEIPIKITCGTGTVLDPTTNSCIPVKEDKEEKPQKSETNSFFDPNKDPRYYVIRYYTEPEYRQWFDKNFPGETIEDKVSYPNTSTRIL